MRGPGDEARVDGALEPEHRPAQVVRGETGLDVGERVRVELIDTDVERGFIDFARA